MTHSSSRFLALGGMLLMLVLYGLNATGNLGPNPIGTTSTATNPLIVPAPWAFAIWAPIYLGLIAFPLYQLFRQRDNHAAWVPLRQWFAANVVANGVWLAFASYDWQWLTVAVIVFMLISLFRINQLLRTIEASNADLNYWLERLVFSLYFAWITLATVLNVSSALHFYGWAGWGVSEVTWTIIMVLIAALIAGYTSRRYQDVAYAAVVIWAFVALAAKHWGAQTQVLSYVAGAVAVVFAGIAVWNWRSRSLAR